MLPTGHGRISAGEHAGDALDEKVLAEEAETLFASATGCCARWSSSGWRSSRPGWLTTMRARQSLMETFRM